MSRNPREPRPLRPAAARRPRRAAAVLAFAALTALLAGAARAGAVFDRTGGFVYAVADEEGRLRAIRADAAGRVTAADLLPPGVRAGSPDVAIDRSGTVWVAWEEWGRSASRVRLGRYADGTLVRAASIPQPAGFNVLPTVRFDRAGRAFAAWSNGDGLSADVWVRDLEAGRSWKLDRAPAPSAPAPKLAVDARNRVWAFWSRRGDAGAQAIHYRVFDGASWSPLRRFDLGTGRSAASPSVAAAPDGSILLAWTESEGRRRIVRTARYSGSAWSAPIDVPKEWPADVDSSPALALSEAGVPVLVWTRTSGAGSFAVSSVFENGAWRIASRAPASVTGPARASVTVSGDRVGIAYSGGSGPSAAVVPLRRLRAAAVLPRVVPDAPRSPFAPSAASVRELEENGYVCFGDSITYGTIGGQDAPDVGYVPRLQALLTDAFGRTTCYNAGKPGEVTEKGLARMDATLDADPGRCLLIMEGTNDIVFNEISMDDSADNLRGMIQVARERGAFPAVATNLPRRDWRWDVEFYRNRLLYLNQEIRAMAADLKVSFEDLFQVFDAYPEGDGGLLSLLDTDLKHPSEKGYQVMADAWFARIRTFPFPPAGLAVRRVDYLLKVPEGPIRFQSLSGGAAAGGGRYDHAAWSDDPRIADPATVSGYLVERRRETDPPTAWTRMAIVTGGVRSFLDKTIDPTKTYFYRVTTIGPAAVVGRPCDPVADRAAAAPSLARTSVPAPSRRGISLLER